MILVERATEPTDELVQALARLVPQLSQSARAPTADELSDLLRSPTTTLLVARDEAGAIVGTLTLVLVRIPTGPEALIEDVVVDERVRGRGIGEALTREAIRLAAEAGVQGVGLTSRPERVAANRLYRRIGFQRRQTNVYWYSLERSAE